MVFLMYYAGIFEGIYIENDWGMNAFKKNTFSVAFGYLTCYSISFNKYVKNLSHHHNLWNFNNVEYS